MHYLVYTSQQKGTAGNIKDAILTTDTSQENKSPQNIYFNLGVKKEHANDPTPFFHFMRNKKMEGAFERLV